MGMGALAYMGRRNQQESEAGFKSPPLHKLLSEIFLGRKTGSVVATKRHRDQDLRIVKVRLFACCQVSRPCLVLDLVLHAIEKDEPAHVGNVIHGNGTHRDKPLNGPGINCPTFALGLFHHGLAFQIGTLTPKVDDDVAVHQEA